MQNCLTNHVIQTIFGAQNLTRHFTNVINETRLKKNVENWLNFRTKKINIFKYEQNLILNIFLFKMGPKKFEYI